MYNRFEPLSWKHCCVIFTFVPFKNLMTNEAEMSSGKFDYNILIHIE